jgi:hypothetical protein
MLTPMSTPGPDTKSRSRCVVTPDRPDRGKGDFLADHLRPRSTKSRVAFLMVRDPI